MNLYMAYIHTIIYIQHTYNYIHTTYNIYTYTEIYIIPDYSIHI